MYIEVEIPNEKAEIFIEFLKSLNIVKKYEIKDPNEITIEAMKDALNGNVEMITLDDLKSERNVIKKN